MIFQEFFDILPFSRRSIPLPQKRQIRVPSPMLSLPSPDFGGATLPPEVRGIVLVFCKAPPISLAVVLCKKIMLNIFWATTDIVLYALRP
jgi:hypothetical protein